MWHQRDQAVLIVAVRGRAGDSIGAGRVGNYRQANMGGGLRGTLGCVLK